MRKKFESLRQELNMVFFEREQVVTALLTALLCGQHILLLGPPGTAKSALAVAICSALQGASYFSWLLTRFSTPEELFGPISLAGLQQDVFQRKVSGKLPEAHISFLDEIFKSNSAVLNSLLTLINERKFYNDGQVVQCPLVSVVGASNELPEGEELNALFDRFIFRFWIGYVADHSNLKKLMLSKQPQIKQKLTLQELQQAQQDVSTVAIPDVTVESILEIKQKLEDEGLVSSDRRWKQILSVLQGYAWLEGETEVSSEHFDILPDMLWNDPKDRSVISSIVGAVSDVARARKEWRYCAAESSRPRRPWSRCRARAGSRRARARLP